MTDPRRHHAHQDGIYVSVPSLEDDFNGDDGWPDNEDDGDNFGDDDDGDGADEDEDY